MKQTTNYNLKKIELTDSPPDITVHSGNFDIIDEELKRLDDDKVDKEEDKQLSDENYTKDEKDKLADIEEEANNYTHPTGAGNKHIPSGGASGQVLKYAGTSGTAKWENEAVTDVIDNLTSSDTDKALSAKQGKALSDTIGPLANLLTTIKTSIVNAINSLKEDIDGHLAESAIQAHKAKNIAIEDAGGHFTATDVEGALNELFTSVSNGKVQVRNAITDKGGTVTDNDGDGIPTFNELSEGIHSILKGAVLKSIQSGTTTIQNNVTTLHVPINRVDLSKSFLVFSYHTFLNDLNLRQGFILGKLNNDEQIVFNRRQGSSGSSTTGVISWFVVEFEEGVSVQTVHGTTSPTNGGSNSYTISPVDLSKTFLVTSHNATSGTSSTWTDSLFRNQASVRLDSPSELVISQREHPTTGHSVDVTCFVVEFLS